MMGPDNTKVCTSKLVELCMRSCRADRKKVQLWQSCKKMEPDTGYNNIVLEDMDVKLTVP